MKIHLLHISYCFVYFCCSYNHAVAAPPGWPVPRPQPWFPPHPAVSVPPPAPLGLAQRPLFPIQNVTPPLSSATLQSFQTTPPGPLSSSTTPVSQPLFPVIGTSIPSQNSQVTAAALSAPITSSTPSELNNPSYSSSNTSMVNGYHAPNIQGLHLSLFDLKYGKILLLKKDFCVLVDIETVIISPKCYPIYSFIFGCQ